MVNRQKTFLFTKTFSEFFSSVWAVTPVWVLGSLPVQAKPRLHSISGIASTARVMTQGGIASTACGRPQALFLQNFHKWKSVKIAHKGTIPLTPSAVQNSQIALTEFLYFLLEKHPCRYDILQKNCHGLLEVSFISNNK